MSNGINEIPSTSPNFQTELARQLSELVPEAIAEGKVDVAKLKELLGDDYGNDNERFGLFWPGKKRALRAAQEPTTATLKPMPSESKDWDTTQNVYIEGDNLEVLKILQKHYHNKIKMIYIDPPYNTGKDFIYPDNYKEGLQSYLEFTRQVDEEGRALRTNSETEGRYHSNWLNMMYPRLKLARNLLTDDGVIFVSISEHEVDNLRKLLNEIFGESNFIGQIAVAKGTTTGQDANDIGSSIDFMLVFSRSKDSYMPQGLPLDENDIARFNQQDERGWYSVLQFRKTGTNDRREDRPNLYYTITAPDGSEVLPVGPGGYQSCWRTARAQFDAWEQDNYIEWRKDENGQFKPYVKYYLEGRTKQVSNYWNDIEGNKKASLTLKELLGKGVFTNPKPVGLIRKCLLVSSDRDSLILDFFSGSGTTAHAVMQLNAEDGGTRRHIQVQLPEPTPGDSEARRAGFRTIAEIGRRRIDFAGEKIKADLERQLLTRESPLDIGYRTYKLVDTNFPKWKVASDVDDAELRQQLLGLSEASDLIGLPDDLLAELLLKQGYSLSEQISDLNIAGLNVRSIGDNLLLALLDGSVKPTLEQLRSLADSGAAKLIILENVFQGDDELKTNLVQICKSKDIELWTA